MKPADKIEYLEKRNEFLEEHNYCTDVVVQLSPDEWQKVKAALVLCGRADIETKIIDQIG
jgi:hypothetical protein